MSSWLPLPIEPGWATVGAAVGLLVVTSGLFAAGPWAILRQREVKPPERPFRFRRTELADFLRKGKSADDPPTWQIYRQAQRWDMGFAVLYGLGLLIVMDGTLGAAFPEWVTPSRLLVYFPTVASVADIVENLGLMKASRRIGSGREPGARFLRLVSVATLIKWLAVVASLVLIAVGSVTLGIHGSAA